VLLIDLETKFLRICLTFGLMWVNDEELRCH
jgi:hypothetical protein